MFVETLPKILYLIYRHIAPWIPSGVFRTQHEQQSNAQGQPAAVSLIINLLFHLLGLGLLMTTLMGGVILEVQYRNTKDVQVKANVLKSLRPIGLMSPVGMVVMLVTGILNMNFVGAGILTYGWLTAKIIFFALLVISGIIFAIQSQKRGNMVRKLSTGGGPADAASQLKKYNGQVTLFYIVMSLLIVLILLLSIIGTQGGKISNV
jgi:uncharacterized membrane protein